MCWRSKENVLQWRIIWYAVANGMNWSYSHPTFVLVNVHAFMRGARTSQFIAEDFFSCECLHSRALYLCRSMLNCWLLHFCSLIYWKACPSVMSWLEGTFAYFLTFAFRFYSFISLCRVPTSMLQHLLSICECNLLESFMSVCCCRTDWYSVEDTSLQQFEFFPLQHTSISMKSEFQRLAFIPFESVYFLHIWE